MKTYRVKKDFVYKDMNGVRKLAGKTFRVDREVSCDEVDENACKGNPACFNFCMRRMDFTYEFDKKLYYGHIVDDEGYDLGYVMCEDELEEELEIMSSGKEWITPDMKITFKEKVRLMFKPMKIIKDVTRDYMLVTYYKEMDGKIYIVKEEKFNY